jgi:DNA polymerase I-like protein with 3'-5' exonuclease and polymerase domains
MMSKHPHANCDACPLRKNPTVSPLKTQGARLLVVDENPMWTESKNGKAYSGKEASIAFEAIKETYPDLPVDYSYAVLCRPNIYKDKKTDRYELADPPKEAILCCSKRLKHEVQQYDYVLAMGIKTILSLKNLATGVMLNHRGIKFEVEGTKCIGTVGLKQLWKNGGHWIDLMFDLKNLTKKSEEHKVKYKIINTLEPFVNLVQQVKNLDEKDRVFVYDLETTGLSIHKDSIRCVAFYNPILGAFIIEPTKELAGMIDLLFTFEGNWIGWNLKFDNQFLLASGIKPPPVWIDVMALSVLADERSLTGLHTLKNQAIKRLNVHDWSKPLEDRMKKHHMTWRTIEEEYLYPYAAMDVYFNYLLYLELIHYKEKEVYKKEVQPVQVLLQKQFMGGIRIDTNKLEIVRHELMQEWNQLGEDLKFYFGSDMFNPNSYKQIREYLFGKMQYTPVEYTKTGAPSTSKDVLAVLYAEHPEDEFLSTLMSYRQVDKVITSYLNTLRELSEHDGYLRPDFFFNGTNSGRLTDRIVLLIPRVTTNRYAKIVRELFIADTGYTFWYADYDQMELRVLACESKSPIYKEIFETGGDPHAQMADTIYTPDWRNLTDAKEWRTSAKNTNFAEKYGGGKVKLARTARINQFLQICVPDKIMQQANEFISKTSRRRSPEYDFRTDIEFAVYVIEQALGEYKAVNAWKQTVYDEVYENEYVETCFGRRRHFPLIMQHKWNEIQRQAVNFKIQSSANSINLRTAQSLDQKYEDSIVRIVSEAHDSIEGVVKTELAEEIGAEMHEFMEKNPNVIYSDFVPFKAEWGLGKSWAEAEGNAG